MTDPKTIGGVPVDNSRRCEGQTTKGRMCKQPAAVGSHFCPYHDPGLKVRTKWDGVGAALRGMEEQS